MAKVISPKEFGKPLGMYSHGMSAPAGEIVVVAGQVGVDARGNVAGGDVGSQTVQALANVRTVVEAAGCSMRDVVRFQTFLVSADDIPAFMKARADALPRIFPDGAYPPNTLLVVSRLVLPELRVEIEAMAVKRARGGRDTPARRPAAKKPSTRRPARRGR